jgi:ribulose-5-phosphate 4-epimerase/fuculose-1-phosphate aldolase
MCVHFAKVKLSNLILVDHAGTVIEGDHAVNRAGFVLHANVHEAHPDIIAMCHAHTVYGTAWCATGRPIDPITQDACAFFEDHVVIGEQGGAVAVENHAGSDVAKAFKGVKAALHQNHGLLTASRHSIESAAFWFIALERCCQQQLAIAASGVPPLRIPDDRARCAGSAGGRGSPRAGRSGSGSRPRRACACGPWRRGPAPRRAASACRDAADRGTALAVRHLDQPAEVEHPDPVGHVAHDAQVVADEQVGQPELVLQVAHQVQDLRLHR